MCVLEISKDEIKKLVKEFEEEWSYSENLIYNHCVEDMKKVKNLCEITHEDIKGPVRTYLINWGMMSRVIKRLDETWTMDLKNVMKSNCEVLSNFRSFDLLYVDIVRYQNDIKNVYESFRKVIKPTSASKALFLISPNFFPMWDTGIREYLLGKNKTSQEDYYKFIGIIQNLLREYKDIVKELASEFGRSKLKIIDKFLWQKTR